MTMSSDAAGGLPKHRQRPRRDPCGGITFNSILALFPAVGAQRSSLLLRDAIDARGVPFVL
jgi:hypothetical protein